MSESKELKDSFTIGTAATGGAIKIYFDDIYSEETSKKIDEAIKLWKNCKLVSGKL
jgi:hypothetical protein